MRDHTESKSDVAHLCRQIELECEALNLAFTGYAAIAKHDIIAHKHAILNSYHEQLANLVGKRMALEISVDIYDQVIQPNTLETMP